MRDSLPVTVVIPTRDRPEHLRAAVESVLSANTVPEELVVVDQSERRNEWLATLDGGDCSVRYVWSREAGVSLARNCGAREATHDLLAFIDDDTKVHPDWLKALVHTLERTDEPVAVTGQVLEQRDPNGGFAPSTKVEPEAASYRGRVRADVLFTGNMGIRRSLLAELGWFDERLGAGGRFPAAADNDFGFRLLEAGCVIVYEPRAVVAHVAWRDQQEARRLRWRYGVGQGGFYAKHLQLRDPFILRRMIGDATRRVARLPVLALRNRQRAIGDVIYLAGVATGTTRWLLTVRAPWTRSARCRTEGP
jgi:GT2 family glycosyltransferase